MLKEIFNKETIKILLIGLTIIITILLIKSIIYNYLDFKSLEQKQKTIDLETQRKIDSLELNIRFLYEVNGYWKGQCEILSKNIKENENKKTKIIEKNKKEIENYYSSNEDEKIKLWNEKLKEFLK